MQSPAGYWPRTAVDLKCGGVEKSAVQNALERGLVERDGCLVDLGRHGSAYE